MWRNICDLRRRGMIRVLFLGRYAPRERGGVGFG